MRVLLVDDQPLVRNGIASLLRAHGHEVVGEARDGEQALIMAPNLRPDIILMDIRMPGMNGLEATRLLKASFPELRIVILTVSDDEQDLFEAVKSGAQGYLLKDLEAAEFFEALRAVERGEAVVPSRLAAKLLDEFRATTQRPKQDAETYPLSPREHEILAMVAAGMTNRETAEKLFISENTVKFHMKNILDKLHLQNRSQVIAWAASRRLQYPSRP